MDGRTDRQKDGQTDRGTDKGTDGGQTDGETEGVMFTQTDRHDECNRCFSQFCEVTSAGNSVDLQ